MQVVCPLPLLEHLERCSVLHHLKQELILCYPNQSVMTAVWLKSGIIRLNENTKASHDLTRPGLYFLDELATETSYPHSVKVLAGAKLWFVTRSEIQAYLAQAQA